MERTILQMRNLGPRCAEWLAEIGIHDESDLRTVGAAVACRELVICGIVQPHRMLLYAIRSALLEIDCNELPRDIKRILAEEASLDGERAGFRRCKSLPDDLCPVELPGASRPSGSSYGRPGAV